VVASGDTVIEGADQGVDAVLSSVAWTLGANVEVLTLTGVLAISATGNALDNVLAGNSAANTLAGGAGNDSYVVSAGDTVVEAAGAGTDEVLSPVTWNLGANIERLTLTGTSAVNGTGNALANTIQETRDNTLNGGGGADRLSGGAGNDTLNGGSGSDTMAGGSGNDIFVVDVGTDVVMEVANEGTDTVMSSVTLRLDDNVENLTLIGSNSINAAGNALDNVLTGNSGSNPGRRCSTTPTLWDLATR
jgi:Ca2+-binding RTX toxin-like protein